MICSEWITSLLRDSINGTLFLSLLLCFLALFFDFLVISMTSTLVSSIKVLGAGSGGVSPFIDLTFSWGTVGLGDTLGFGTISGSNPCSGGSFGTSGSILLTSCSVGFDTILWTCSS